MGVQPDGQRSERRPTATSATTRPDLSGILSSSELIFADLARFAVIIDLTPDGVGGARPESVASPQQCSLDFGDLRLQI